jgi:membrane protein DedA with SNARE-associated domain
MSSKGNTLSALVGYKVGQTLGDIFDFNEKKKNLSFNLGKLPIDSPYILLFGRLIPGGVRGLSYVAGAYQVPMKLYLPTTLTMVLLSAFFIAFGGDKLNSLI